MFRNMNHVYKVIKRPELNSKEYETFMSNELLEKPRVSFILDIFITRETKMQKCNLAIYTNHLLSCFQYNHNARLYNNYIDYNHFDIYKYPIVLCRQPYSPQIYFSKKYNATTYKYSFPNLFLDLENRFMLVDETQFEGALMNFTPIYSAKGEYNKSYTFSTKKIE